MSYFVPPCNYGMVEHDLSRSGQCHQLNFPFLERHNLKTVMYLSYDEPAQPFLGFLEDQGIELIRPSPERAELHSQASSMSEAEVLSALQVIFLIAVLSSPCNVQLWPPSHRHGDWVLAKAARVEPHGHFRGI